MALLPEEKKYLTGPRCEACGHLAVLHNDHCCSFCLLPDCPCEWGILQKHPEIKTGGISGSGYLNFKQVP